MPFAAYAATDNPCDQGPSAILNLIDRPSNADSICTVPANKQIVEAGYAYFNLPQGTGTASTFTDSDVRFGLPANSELFILVPTYTTQTLSPRSGFTNTAIGIKHIFAYNQKWMFTAESVIVLPDGSAAFGSQQTGYYANAIASYDLTDKWNALLMLGVSDVSIPRYFNGLRFSSFNPDLLLTYSFSDNVNVFGEVYAQTHTGPFQGSGVNVDAGIMYKLSSSIVADIAYGQRVYGYLYGLDNYITTGLSIMF